MGTKIAESINNYYVKDIKLMMNMKAAKQFHKKNLELFL